MSVQVKLTDNFDYLQRVAFNPGTLTAALPRISAPDAQLHRWLHVNGIGYPEKALHPERQVIGQSPRLPSEDALIGLCGAKTPLSFLVSNDSRGIAIQIGVWSPQEENARPGQLDEQKAILESVLRGVFPAVDFRGLAPGEMQLPRLPRSGFGLGIPSVKPPDPLDNSLQMDRLIRASSGAPWAFLVLAKPVDESETTAVRNGVVNEMRMVESAAKAQLAPGPLAEAYTEMLKTALKSLTQAQAVGGWRTAVYLLGDESSYDRLSSVWRSVFSGDQSLPEPIRVWNSSAAADLALQWAMPKTEGAPGPGFYRHPFQYQTLLSSSQLSAFIHLPQVETIGFAIKSVPNFDVMRPASQGDLQISLGQVLMRGNKTEVDYQIRAKDLRRHAFVAGVTGAGKTNTVFHILKEATKSKIPFAVIEPAKTEYRGLINDPHLHGNLQVFTLGDELTSPFRLNPFQVVSWPTIPVGVHIDLLRSVFSASFGMWTPLPQILEQCLHAVYKDRGWDTTANSNYRLDARSDVADAFPTLAELAAKVDEVIQELGYEQKITDDMRAALLTRLNGLRAGAKGRMLDVQRSLPMDELLQAPTVFELQEMGDDDDKAFLMGLLLIRLYEYRRAVRESADLQHLLVIEEAHRLLTNVGPRRDQEEADPRGKAVETFGNLLSEIRAYGQGVIVADQIPVKLAPEIIKNTNLKIVHRVVAADDRGALAGAMVMDEPQARALATFQVGEAAIFSEGDDAPILAKVTEEKGDATLPDQQVIQYRSTMNIVKSNPMLFQPLLPDVDISQPAVYTALEAARAASDDPSFRRDFVRYLISRTEWDQAPDPLWDELVARAQMFRLPGIGQSTANEDVVMRAVIVHMARWFAQRRGSQNGWSFADTNELEDKLRQVLLAKRDGRDATRALDSFRDLMYRLHSRRFEPFPGCAAICTQSYPIGQQRYQALCLYRRAVADHIAPAREKAVGAFKDAMKADEEKADGYANSWDECKSAAHQLVEYNNAHDDVTKRIGLCYAQHMLADDVRLLHDEKLAGLTDKAVGSANGGRDNE